MQQLENSFPGVQTDRTDGLKLIWPDKWIHVRASNTEPILRFSAEATTSEETDKLYVAVEKLLK
jgi:phosphomannomutase